MGIIKYFANSLKYFKRQADTQLTMIMVCLFTEFQIGESPRAPVVSNNSLVFPRDLGFGSPGHVYNRESGKCSEVTGPSGGTGAGRSPL